MYKRLYFLFPDANHAQTVVNELVEFDVSQDHMHAMAKRGVDLGNLPRASLRQRRDMAHKIEYTIWQIDLAVFAFASILFLYHLFQQAYALSLLMLLIMAITFIVGYIWTNVPDTPIREFRHEMAHNEILLMIDVPTSRVYEVGEKVHRNHPEAIAGGTTWMVDAFGL